MLEHVTHGDPDAPRVIVLLHGRDMEGADLAPFASSLAVPDALFVVPTAPDPSPHGKRAWWPLDTETRPPGGADLADRTFAGRDVARARLAELCAPYADRALVLVGFSQGGMLAMDATLHGDVAPHALALLSSTRIDLADWQPRAAVLRDRPILVAHGTGDQELAFSAGEGLRDFAIAAGAKVTWLPFDGVHELPLAVWRGLRKWLAAIR